MDFKALLQHVGIDPTKVIMLRHRPTEPALRKALPWLAEEHHQLFNAYQQFHGPTVEQALSKLAGAGVVASFIGIKPAEAIFVGLYDIASRPERLTQQQFASWPEVAELMERGMQSQLQSHDNVLRFGLERRREYLNWAGRLTIVWTGGERSWWRRAHLNEYAVSAIHPESLFAERLPEWDRIVLTRTELKSIPQAWQDALKHWRGIYLIHDRLDGKQYVGSAYGRENLLGRWRQYAESGHGGNRWLKQRDPNNFVFSILQRTSPDLEADEVIRIEQSWKARLHTSHPGGLNDN